MTRGRDETTGPGSDLAGVLHDVSNALTVLLGWVDAARRPDASAAEIAEALDVVEQRARLARDLARRALGGAPQPEPSGASVTAAHAVVGDVVHALAVEASRAAASLRVELDDRARAMSVRRGADLGHVVTNLVLNAIAHAPRGSEIVVATRVEHGEIVVEVRDEGAGVPEARRERVFEGDSTRPGGTGVGLRHARGVARAVGGDVTLAPASARGACFVARWPAFLDEAPPPSAPALSMRSRQLASALRGKRVLLLEDDVAVVDLVHASLEARGAEVFAASRADELATAFDGEAFDAALVDVSPIADDVEGALRALRRRAPQALLVLVTGSVDALPPLASLGDVRLVRKPFEIRELIDVLGTAGAARGAKEEA